jgi:hypothetical protein
LDGVVVSLEGHTLGLEVSVEAAIRGWSGRSHEKQG